MAEKRTLVIVESPAKAKTIAKYLGDGYEVMASVGHVRDLVAPKEVPAELKPTHGKFGVDIEHGFAPLYIDTPRAKSTIADLKKALKNSDELLLATDEDREGESIAWHLLEVLKPKVPVLRMVFHEITQDAISEAVKQPRDIDMPMVDAQETRRILDRLFGYQLSPVLWSKVGPGLSAGRVQSPALRLIVDRERERRAFVAASYWDVAAIVSTTKGETFDAKVTKLGDNRLATGRDFDDNGQLNSGATILDEATAQALAKSLEISAPTVSNIESKPYTRRPAAPFTTSTLQQEAGRKLRLGARDTMRIAQSLYQNGHITYMRTDSISLSAQAITAARSQAVALYGESSIPSSPRTYQSKVKNAQEAHEAIRPAGDTFKTPDQMRSVLSADELRLYDLIWKRTVASQMVDATGETVSVTMTAPVGELGTATLTAAGTTITNRGFLAAYEEGQDQSRDNDDESESKIPNLTVGAVLTVPEVDAKGHLTSPPPRYTEASLVKALEERGIGRPSTYASIIGVLFERGYVTKRGTALVPGWVAFAVITLLENFYNDFVEYDFTAELENDLDRISNGELKGTDYLQHWYFGSGDHAGLVNTCVDWKAEIDARETNSFPIGDNIVVRSGKYGPYLECTDTEGERRNVSIPDGLAPDELTLEKAQELRDAPEPGSTAIGVSADGTSMITARVGRFGAYIVEQPVDTEILTGSEGVYTLPEWTPRKVKGKDPKPRTASLFKSMDPTTVDLETCIKLFSLPRTVGIDPENEKPITAQNGPYGPYLKRGTESRSLDTEEQIFEITLDEALALFAQPKYGSRSASNIKELEPDPVSGKPIKIKSGKFGPYVTDGETNATIPAGEVPEEVSFDRAVELLADRRAKGPAKKPARRTRAK
ncbi:MAG: type I DNA topoisomerase [Microbacteriaceae bacterium]